jgi:hypothetical protein
MVVLVVVLAVFKVYFALFAIPNCPTYLTCSQVRQARMATSLSRSSSNPYIFTVVRATSSGFVPLDSQMNGYSYIKAFKLYTALFLLSNIKDYSHNFVHFSRVSTFQPAQKPLHHPLHWQISASVNSIPNPLPPQPHN